MDDSGDVLYLTETGDREGIATAQPEVGALGDVGEFFLGVAEGLGDGLAILDARGLGGGAVVLANFGVDLGGVRAGHGVLGYSFGCLGIWCSRLLMVLKEKI